MAPVTAPLFKADSATLTLSGEKDGKIRVNYPGWEDARVVKGDDSFPTAHLVSRDDRKTLGGPRGGWRTDRYA